MVVFLVAVVGQVGDLEALILPVLNDVLVEVGRVAGDDEARKGAAPAEVHVADAGTSSDARHFIEHCIGGSRVVDVEDRLASDLDFDHFLFFSFFPFLLRGRVSLGICLLSFSS